MKIKLKSGINLDTVLLVDCKETDTLKTVLTENNFNPEVFNVFMKVGIKVNKIRDFEQYMLELKGAELLIMEKMNTGLNKPLNKPFIEPQLNTDLLNEDLPSKIIGLKGGSKIRRRRSKRTRKYKLSTKDRRKTKRRKTKKSKKKRRTKRKRR